MSDNLTATPLGIISRPFSHKLIQTVGFTVAAFLAGQAASLTNLVTPAILRTLDVGLLARQWRESIQRASRGMAPLVVASAAVGAWCAWRGKSQPSHRRDGANGEVQNQT